ncbi:Pentatricopeptide repeat-containing protein 1, mitochondrial [Tyrophagus putrescentiae]|nr:Pentatricopeptide repeat-containing protein 1, mitochondrial [Tyrophagus putrescentiae]
MYHLSGGGSGSRLLVPLLAKCVINVPACSSFATSYSITKRLPLKQQRSKEEDINSSSNQLKNVGPPRTQAKADLYNTSEGEINFTTLEPDRFGDLFEQYGRQGPPPTPSSVATSSKIVHAAPLKSETEVPDDADGYDKLEIKRDVRRKSPEAYMRMMNELKRQRPLPVARIFELHQAYVYEERYQVTDTRFYSLLMKVAGQAGFTRKAVELLEEMKRFELRPTKSTITALFNACANAPVLDHPETAQYALQQTLRLREKLQLEGYELNDIQYNVLVKAFARLGDMANARATLAEMAEKGRPLSLDTYAMMLMGCIGNRRSGLLEATRLLHQMLATSSSNSSSSSSSTTNSVQLDLPIINLFLRAIRDCDLSREDLEAIQSSPLLLTAGLQQQQKMISEEKFSVMISEGELLNVNKSLSSSSSNELQQNNYQPNLLTGANLNSIVAIDHQSLSRPSNRFLLFGGLPGFTALMDAHHITPSLKTVTLFVDLLPRVDEAALEEIRALLRRYRLKADTTLYNVLLKRAAKSAAKGKGPKRARALCQTILKVMQSEDHLQPDIMTFGALTFSCSDARSARNLLADMARCGVAAPNAKILGSLVNIACREQDLDYVIFLLEYMEGRKISLSRLDVEQIDLLLKGVRREIVDAERKGATLGEPFKASYERAKYLFSGRLQQSTVQVNVNPWAQFEPNGQQRRTSGKAPFNAFVRAMKAKMDVKHRRGRREDSSSKVVDYNDEIDD